MATTLSTVITNARVKLLETTATFWTDAELLVDAIDGVRDLWKAVLALDENHFTTQDVALVSLAASTGTLTGVPADLFRVELIEPRDLLSTATVQNMTFSPRALNHPDFTGARSLGSVAPSGRTFYYAVLGAGSPVAAPTIEVAPKSSDAVLLRLTYTAGLASMTSASNNPIPGESDHALMAWIVAHARCKEREDRSPDPEWLAIYAADKAHIIESLTPRQVQEPEIVEAFFEPFWG